MVAILKHIKANNRYVSSGELVEAVLDGGVGDGISGGDIFAMKFDTSDWSIVYSTYIGGDADEGGRAIAVDDEGNLYIGGMSQSSNFPITDDAFQKVKNGQVYVQDPQQHADYYTMDAILSVLSADGSELLYSTYIGGNYGEFIMGVELIDGGVILQFRTYSDDLWVSENAFQKVKGTDLYNLPQNSLDKDTYPYMIVTDSLLFNSITIYCLFKDENRKPSFSQPYLKWHFKIEDCND